MAERSGDLENVERPDAISSVAGSRDSYLEKSTDGYPVTESERTEVATNTGDAPAETEQIKARIEETRHQMGETIDAIQERLSFTNISEQVSETVSNAIETAKDTAYDATIGKAVNFMRNVGDGVTHSGAFRTVRNNPFPLALIGIGAGLLAYQAFAKGSSRVGNGRDRRFSDRATGPSGRTLGAARNAIGDVTHRAYDGITHTAEGALGSVKNAAGNAYEAVSGKLTDAYTGAGEVAHKAYERAGEYGTIAHEKYDEYLEENPLALGAVALAVGAAVGFAIPSTQYEGRLMGDARENLVLRAQDAAGSLVEKAKKVANEAGQTIKDEAHALAQ